MKNKSIDSFKVVLNWKGIFEAVTFIIGIIMGLIFFLCLIYMGVASEVKDIFECLVFLAPLIVAIIGTWRLSHLLSDRIIVQGEEIVIKRAFKKKKVISPQEIISYSNTVQTVKFHSYNEIVIKFGDNESIYIGDNIYKNYDILLYYLSKNVHVNKTL